MTIGGVFFVPKPFEKNNLLIKIGETTSLNFRESTSHMFEETAKLTINRL